MMIPIVAVLLVAPVIGSFLGAMATRIPDGRPLMWARSECESCGHVLSTSELIPFASFLWQRGRCRDCGAPIGVFPLAMEIAAVGVVAWAALLTSGAIFVVSCIFGWALLLLAAIDWRAQLLPDIITLPMMLAGLVASFLVPLGNLMDHTIGAAAGFIVLACIGWVYRQLRQREGLGLGDAKLFAALGAWIGWRGLPAALLWGSMLGLLFVIALSMAGRKLQLSDRIPFGVFLAAGGWLVWLYGPLGFALA